MLSALQTQAGCELSLPIYSLLLYLSFPPCPFLPSSSGWNQTQGLVLARQVLYHRIKSSPPHQVVGGGRDDIVGGLGVSCQQH